MNNINKKIILFLIINLNTLLIYGMIQNKKFLKELKEQELKKKTQELEKQKLENEKKKNLKNQLLNDQENININLKNIENRKQEEEFERQRLIIEKNLHNKELKKSINKKIQILKDSYIKNYNKNLRSNEAYEILLKNKKLTPEEIQLYTYLQNDKNKEERIKKIDDNVYRKTNFIRKNYNPETLRNENINKLKGNQYKDFLNRIDEENSEDYDL